MNGEIKLPLTLKEKLKEEIKSEKKLIIKFMIIMLLSNLMVYFLCQKEEPIKVTHNVNPDLVNIGIPIKKNLMLNSPQLINILNKNRKVVLENILLTKLVTEEDRSIAYIELQRNQINSLLENKEDLWIVTPFFKSHEKLIKHKMLGSGYEEVL